MVELLTTGKLARETEYSVERIRQLDDLGVITSQKDNNGRRLFTKRDIATIRAYRESRTKRMTGAAINT